MGYIVDHEIIKSWKIYKQIIYLKDGLHISPLLDLELDQYINPLTNFKMRKVARKAGYAAALSLFCVYIVELKQT